MKPIALRQIFCLSLIIALNGCQKRVDEPSPKVSQEMKQVAKPEEQKDHTPANEAEDPADQYYVAWLLSREAENAVDPEEKLRKFEKSLDQFQAIKAKFPDWKTKMVNDRIQITMQQVARLKKPQP